MQTTQEIRHEILTAYPKAITHLRRQFAEKRFGIVVGSGISRDFNIPLWHDLVVNIAKDADVDGFALIDSKAVKEKSLPYKTEMLFQRYRSKKAASLAVVDAAQENLIQGQWLDVCRKHLYGGVAPDFAGALAKHPYLNALIPLVQGSYLTVNFNFDDCLEAALRAKRRPNDQYSRGFEVVTDPWPQFRRTDCVIYHPHGFVPRGAMESPVDRFVFSEAAYSKQYVGARGHDSSFMLAHFARTTCVLLGCSLEDELRNVLLRGAHVNPGNYHYYIHYISSEAAGPIPAERELIAETNFKVYNLITLFLTPEKIDQFFRLIDEASVSDDQLDDLAKECGIRLKFVYYMTGSIGVGKSTAANNLRSLLVLDEWIEERPQVLSEPWDQLTAQQQKEADDFIVGQFKIKNTTLRHLKHAIAIVDRPPLDPLLFTKVAERPAKAAALLSTICPNDAYQVEPGMIVVLTGEPSELSARVMLSGRTKYNPSRLTQQQEDVLALYSGAGVKVIDTRFLSVGEVTKLVADVIHRQAYVARDLTADLKAHKGA